jgi:type I restriction enzyme S subunit
LDLEDIEKDSGKLLKRVRKIEKDSKSTRNVFKKGDVLYSKLRTYLNKVLIADQKGYCTTEILPLDFNGFVVPEYARYVLMSNYFLDYTAECCYGVKMPRLGTYDGENAPFPLPPLNEQKRISSKINSLFVLIDRINENQLSLEQFVNQTKSKVLELAIKGKLVPQNPEDEPASTLLERLGIKKASSDTSHYPFEVPKNWLWCNFSDLYILISGRDLDKDEFNDVGFGIPYLIGASSLINNQFEVNRWTTTPKVLSEKDDLLITCKGTVGELIINDIGKVHIARQFMAIRSIVKIKTKFTKYFFEYSIETIKERAKGVIPGISRKDILEIFIPLPPLAEQKRIVSQIEKIFAQLEIIEDSLKA